MPNLYSFIFINSIIYDIFYFVYDECGYPLSACTCCAIYAIFNALTISFRLWFALAVIEIIVKIWQCCANNRILIIYLRSNNYGNYY